MGPDEVPGNVIGSVEAREVNATSAWLAQLVERHDLPEKLFLIHQFTDDMVDDTRLQERPGLAMVLNADGFGGQAIKKGEVPRVHALAARVLPQGLQALLPRGHRPHEPAPGAAAAAAARRRDLRVTLRLPDPCLVVLVGATGAGKSAWAGAWFDAGPDRVLGSPAGGRRRGRARSAREPRRVRAARPDRREAPAPRPHDGGGLDRARAEAARRLARARRARGRAGLRDRPRHAGEGRARAQPGPRDAGARQGRRRPAARGGRRTRARWRARASRASTTRGRSRSCRPRSWAPRRRPPARRRIRWRSSSGSRSRASGGRARPRGALADVARAAEEAGFTQPVADGPLPPDPAGGARVGGHARELHDARLPRRRDGADPARHARHRRHLPQPRPPRQDRGDARRALRRPRAVRPRRRLVRARAPALRLGRSRRSPSATRCWRTRSSCCR